MSLGRLDQPMTALQDLRGTIVIDEIQRRRDLFPLLRVAGVNNFFRPPRCASRWPI